MRDVCSCSDSETSHMHVFTWDLQTQLSVVAWSTHCPKSSDFASEPEAVSGDAP